MLCTANQCRSPMAESLLRDRLTAAGVRAVVRSAGELPGGAPASGGSIRAMAARGLDLGPHRSQSLSPAMLSTPDLILAMARRHVRAAVAMAPEVFGRTFTLRELVRRGETVGRRHAGESLPAWLARCHEGRTAAALLGDDELDDVADPIGGPDAGYEATAADLSRLIDRLFDLAFAPAAETRETA